MSVPSDTANSGPPAPDIPPEVLARYDRPGPRYTSYPTAPVWSEAFGEAAYREALARAAETDAPLSLYVHVPFCRERCTFCGCNVIITRKQGVTTTYLDYVERELDLLAAAIGTRRPLRQVHWGGGTPTHLTLDEMARLDAIVRARFRVEQDAELALEVDPRVTSREQIQWLRETGFNRISMGVQDLEPEVQEAIGRYQTEEETRRLYAWCRDAGFTSVNMDLVYGLPGQTPARWAATLDAIAEMRPDRLAVYSFALLPDKLRNQKRIDSTRVPTGLPKYRLLAMARERFAAAGYTAIGMDHFALPEDELAVALRARRLHRNFMGYTVALAPDMLGAGTSAIGEVGGAFAQNEKKLSRYYAALDAGEFATAAGMQLSADDQMRGWVIRQITCNFHVDFDEFSAKFGESFTDYFAHERAALAALEADEFVRWTSGALVLLPLGQVFVRNVAMVFDAYLNRGRRGADRSGGEGGLPDAHQARFSRTI